VYVVIGLIALVVLDGCDKDEPVNPFDDPSIQPPVVVPFTETLDPNSFAYLHKYIFKPTCSNSGCHDGTFEPDFRTIYSSYNTLVYQPLISNDVGGTFTYRVLPGDANMSILHERLINFIPNSSGIMPLSVDPGSDWEQKETTYIQNIINWINNGALDIYGNAPTTGNLQPEGIGIVVFPSGATSNPYGRTAGSETPIEVPAGAVDVWFALADDATSASQMQFNQYKLHTSPYDFTNVSYGTLQIESPITEDDLWGTSVSFTHKASLNLSSYPVGSYLYIRAYVQDADHVNPVEFPNDGSSELMLGYFTLKII
jgi:hypothetical protein